MEIIKTNIDGVLLIKPRIFGDSRGYFVETWQKQRYEDIGINLPFVQDNHSKSGRGILRGLHFQKKHPQGKLVMVSYGEVFDVAVDLEKTQLLLENGLELDLVEKINISFGFRRVWPMASWF